MEFEPVIHRIIVKQLNLIETDDAYKRAKALGIDLSAEHKMKREQAAIDRGIVVAFGPTVFKDYGIDNPLKVGDEIIFARHAGKALTEDKDAPDQFVAINDEDVVCIIKKEVQ